MKMIKNMDLVNLSINKVKAFKVSGKKVFGTVRVQLRMKADKYSREDGQMATSFDKMFFLLISKKEKNKYFSKKKDNQYFYTVLLLSYLTNSFFLAIESKS